MNSTVPDTDAYFQSLPEYFGGSYPSSNPQPERIPSAQPPLMLCSPPPPPVPPLQNVGLEFWGYPTPGVAPPWPYSDVPTANDRLNPSRQARVSDNNNSLSVVARRRPNRREGLDYDCIDCDSSFRNHDRLKAHVKETHEPAYSYSCQHDCKVTVNALAKFNRHHKKCHSAQCLVTPRSEWINRCARKEAFEQKVAYGCGLCGAFLSSLEESFKHYQEQHFRWRSTGARLSDDLVISGLLKQPHLAEAWDSVKDWKAEYTWPSETAKILKKQLGYGHFQDQTIRDHPEFVAQGLARFALATAVVIHH